MRKVHFNGLNGVRFLAALLVIVAHTEEIKSSLGYDTLLGVQYCYYLGAFGVTIFFVLSGFLITYLLLQEKKEGTINVRNFYIRRILRIWPLYYAIVILGFFVAPHIGILQMPMYSSEMVHFGRRLALFSGLMANVAFVYLPYVPFANVLWSVAVEEQFYLTWPHVLKVGKYLLPLMILLIAMYVYLKLALSPRREDGLLLNLVEHTRFSSMIIGGVGAYLVFHKHHILRYLYVRASQILILGAFFGLLFNLIPLGHLELVRNEITSGIICVMILNIATNPRSLVKLDHAVLDHLGKISYGLYVYHSFMVAIAIRLLSRFLPMLDLNNAVGYPVLVIAILAMTVLVSHLSYSYFEEPFLRRKLRYSTIASGDLADRGHS